MINLCINFYLHRHAGDVVCVVERQPAANIRIAYTNDEGDVVTTPKQFSTPDSIPLKDLEIDFSPRIE